MPLPASSSLFSLIVLWMLTSTLGDRRLECICWCYGIDKGVSESGLRRPFFRRGLAMPFNYALLLALDLLNHL